MKLLVLFCDVDEFGLDFKHSIYRGIGLFVTHSVADFVADSWQTSKPSLNLEQSDFSLLPALV